MVEMYKLKLTILQQEIMRFLFVHAGERFNARRLALKIGVSQTAISKALPFLEKSEIVKIEKDKESKRFSIELNRDNQIVAGLKRADNLKQIYESGLAQFLYDSFPGATIILFGSYSFGEDIINSDIDLAVIGLKQKDINLEKYEKILRREIIVNFYSSFKGIHKHLKNNILNGILIKGGVEL